MNRKKSSVSGKRRFQPKSRRALAAPADKPQELAVNGLSAKPVYVDDDFALWLTQRPLPKKPWLVGVQQWLSHLFGLFRSDLKQPARKQEPYDERCFGTLVITPGAESALLAASMAYQPFLERHVAGDWGVVSKSDKELND